MPWQLFVVDGADAKRVYPLPEAGSVVIGNSHKHADICLHDLYVARCHCHIEVADGLVTVLNQINTSGTFVNKTKVEEKATIAEGDVLRVGNSYLKLEPAETAAAPTKPQDPKELPNVSAEHLGELVGYVLGHYELEELLGR